MARFLRSKSFSSLTTRPNLFLASSSQPDLPAWPDSSPAPKAASALPSIGRLAIQHASITLISIRAQWNQGLIQHHNFHLHAALTTFKRLIRALRSPTEESSSTITEEYASIDSSPYQILLPEEVALLYINIALIHAYLGSYYLAAAAFEEALLLDEISGIAWFGLGIARFYLKELGASKRAFDKCLACFDAYDTDGGKYRMDELTYHVWSGRPKADCERGGIADMEVSKDAVRDLDPFKDILCSRIPDGRWKLKLVRVDWNWRTVLFERNWVRRGVPRPGDGKWGMCGIPAGVIFALDSDTVGRSTAESHRADEHFDVKHTESVIDNDRIRIRDLKGTRGSLVRRKWADIQHKFLKRKPSTKRPAPLLLSASSSGTIPSPTFLNEQSRFANYHYGGSRTPTRAQAQPHFPELDERLLPLASPLTQHAVGSLDDEDPDEEEIRLMIDRHEKIASGATWAFPTRQSSLSVPMKIPPRRRSRSQRLSINTVVHDVEDTIENDYSKEEKEGGQQREHDRHPETPDSDISPQDPSHGVRPLDTSMGTTIPAPDFTKDFIAVPNPRRSRSKSPPAATPTTTEYGHDSFMTDAISSLDSAMSSVLFPPFSDSRRPSHASSYASTPDDADEEDDDEDGNSLRLSTIFTLTPATPLPSRDSAPVVERGSSMQEELDPGFLPPYAEQPFDGMLLSERLYAARQFREEVMEVEPLRVWKKDGYERWCGREQEQESVRGRDDGGEVEILVGYEGDGEGDGEEDCGYGSWELLKPTVFEGF